MNLEQLATIRLIYEDGHSPLLISLNPNFHGMSQQIKDISFKKLYHPVRDVDNEATTKLLLKAGANIRLKSKGLLPIFSALKLRVTALQAFLAYDDDRAETVNQQNEQGETPLIWLCKQNESEENVQKVAIMLKLGARIPNQACENHPLTAAVEAQNYSAARLIQK